VTRRLKELVAIQPEGYYADKIESLADIFDAGGIEVSNDELIVDGRAYPIIDDIIILLDPAQYPESLKARLTSGAGSSSVERYAPEIQMHYGKFWKEWNGLLPYHEREFAEYFDLVDLRSLDHKRVCDLGCGMGRWSYMLLQRVQVREAVLVDFSEAIFTARRLLAGSPNVLFFMGDITRLPFRRGFTDFIMALGVLHHLPVDCLEVVRQLKHYAPRLLIYLYYALDNKPCYYRWLLQLYTPLRLRLWQVRSDRFRVAFSWFGLLFFYLPFIGLGYALKPFGLSKYVPLFEEHHWAGLEGMRHSVYDRFFTHIEQRVTHAQIAELSDTFARVTIADGQAYWHFLCEA
jgi:SAM-dependent methyltransferase